MEPVTALILAGGRSSRMGRDKAWLDLNGMPLVEHVARRLLPLAEEVVFSANDPDAFGTLIDRLPVPGRVAVDAWPGAGPLAGLHAGLRAARNDLVLAVATDMPFVSAEVVRAMMAWGGSADAIIARLTVGDRGELSPEPLHALYRKACLPAIERALAAGRRRAVAFLDDVHVFYVDADRIKEIDPELLSFRNVNTAEEWEEVRAVLARRG
jgi:molybdenum cofactor guanylyltransferase